MNKQEIINKLNILYANRRTSAQNLAYHNLLKARKNAEFSKLEKQIKQLTFDLGKAQAFGNTSDAKALKQQLITATVKQEQLLNSIKLTKQDLSPKYMCQNCNDTGRKNSKLCECYKKELYAMLLKNSGAKTDLASFAQFNENIVTDQTQKQQLLKMRAKFETWVKEYPNTKTHTFLFCGKTGVGKTFMTECIAEAMINRGYLVSFISAFGINNNFLKYHTTFDDNKQSYYDMLVEPELLVIDDLGTEPILKNVTINYLCALLNDRFNSKKATIITTNLTLEQLLDRYGNRIFSRIVNKADSELFNLVGDDLRLKKR